MAPINLISILNSYEGLISISQYEKTGCNILKRGNEGITTVDGY
jgi:hypothetical protein